MGKIQAYRYTLTSRMEWTYIETNIPHNSINIVIHIWSRLCSQVRKQFIFCISNVEQGLTRGHRRWSHDQEHYMYFELQACHSSRLIATCQTQGCQYMDIPILNTIWSTHTCICDPCWCIQPRKMKPILQFVLNATIYNGFGPKAMASNWICEICTTWQL